MVSEAIRFIWFEFNPEKAIHSISNIHNKLDQLIGQIFLCYYYQAFGDVNNFKTSIETIKRGVEDLDDSYLYFHYCFLQYMNYLGWSNINNDDEQADLYFVRLSEIIKRFDFYNSIEKSLIYSFYHFGLATRGEGAFKSHLLKDEGELDKAIEFNSIETQGTQYHNETIWFRVILLRFRADINIYNGKIEEAENNLNKVAKLAYDIDSENESRFLYLVEILSNLAILKYFQGEITGAIEFLEEALEIAITGKTVPPYIFSTIQMLSKMHFELGNTDNSERMLKKSIQLREENSAKIPPFMVFMGHYALFHHYYLVHELYPSPENWEKVQQIYQDIDKFRKNYPMNTNISLYFRFSKALTLKLGNLRKKAEAMTIFEELYQVEVTQDLQLNELSRLHLIDLLFQDIQLTNDQDSIIQLENLFNEERDRPKSLDPSVLLKYISYQILFSKYLFYIKSEIDIALETLDDLETLIEGTDLNTQRELIQNEKNKFMSELAKWEKIDLDVRERIKQSKLQDYIKKAQSFMTSI